jgi:hypothetical protein
MCRKLELFSSSGEWSETPTLFGPSPSPEGGTRSLFRNVVFSSYLEFQMSGKVQKPIDSKTDVIPIHQFSSSCMRERRTFLLEVNVTALGTDFKSH